MKRNLTTGSIIKTMLLFAGPMVVGNLLQQFYNIADTLIVGRFLGSAAMASVGAAYTLMTFLTSILIGLCMGSGSLVSFYFGKQDNSKMKSSVQGSFLLIGGVTVLVNMLVFLFIDQILQLLHIPAEILTMCHTYVQIIFVGIFFVFLYNYYAYLLRAIGNSIIPLIFLGSSAILNVGLDILFVVAFQWGIGGAAWATVISQILLGIGITIYVWVKEPDFRIGLLGKNRLLVTKESLKEISRFSFAASIQQSVMNLGILMIQGLVNSFGVAVMAAFTAAVKIDSFAYMPVQEFGNAFSMFISQNHGAQKKERIRKGTRQAMGISTIFCGIISLLVFVFARALMLIFVSPSDTEIIRIGVQYLRTEGTFYIGIGILFLLYGFYRGINLPEMSLVLTVISLGIRVLLAYLLAPVKAIGVAGIWWAIPIGWILADLTGIIFMRYKTRKELFLPFPEQPL